MTGLLRLLGPQGIAGLLISTCLAGLLAIEKVENGQLTKQADRFLRLYRESESSRASLIADYRAAADRARAIDVAKNAKTRAAQTQINDRSERSYDTRIADVRARAQRLRDDKDKSVADRSGGGNANMPIFPVGTGAVAEGARENRFSDTDRLIATEQAIQLDELIRWVRAQAAVDRDAQ